MSMGGAMGVTHHESLPYAASPDPIAIGPLADNPTPAAGADGQRLVAVLAALDALDARLAAMDRRLITAERTLGLPAPRHGTAVPDLPALVRRVAALERQRGLIPGLDPLPGFAGSPSPPRPVAPLSARARWTVWPGLALVAVGIAVALVVLPHPGAGPAQAPPATPSPAVATLAVRPAIRATAAAPFVNDPHGPSLWDSREGR
jgi:hypothetical protein